MGVTGVAKSMRRHRSGLTPMYVTTGVVAVGEAAQYVPLTPVVLGMVGTGMACASWVNIHGGDDRNKLYLWSVLGVSTSAVLTLHELGWSHFDWTAIIAAGLGAALGIPWWRNNRRVTKVNLERTGERWPSLARKLHMDTVRPVDIRANGEGNFEENWYGQPGISLCRRSWASGIRLRGLWIFRRARCALSGMVGIQIRYCSRRS